MFATTTKTARVKRSKSGLLALVLPLFILLVSVGLAALGTDIAHSVDARSELQNATDAGALAGALDLISTTTSGQAITHALQTAALNKADGRACSQNSPHTTVSAQIFTPVSNFILGQCQCNADMQINNIFAGLFGVYTLDVNTTSTATCYSSLVSIDPGILFPLAVSIDTLNGHTVPLYQNKVGDTVTFYIDSQQYKNSAWTSFTNQNMNANWLDQAIDSALGINFVPGLIPGVNVGDQIRLGNGVFGTKDLTAGAENTALLGEIIYLPVIAGDPAYNQTRTLLGWIAFQVTKVEKNLGGGKVLKFTGTLVKGMTKGVPGQIITGNSYDGTLNSLSPGMVQLTH